MSAPSEQQRGRKKQLVTKETLLEKNIVRDKKDSMGIT